MQKKVNSEVRRHLASDPVFAAIIKEDLVFEWGGGENLFQAITENILGQQLGGPAAEAITARFRKLFKGKKFPNPVDILSVPDERLRGSGMSWAKAKYIKNLAQAVVDGKLDLENIQKLSDEEVIGELVQVKGIGRWTAEMILIFHLGRPDVFSLGDLGLRTAVSRLYHVDRDNLKKIEKISRKWSPYRSLASRYLWRSIDNKKTP